MTREEAKDIVRRASDALQARRSSHVLCSICMHEVPRPGCDSKDKSHWCNYNVDEADNPL